MLIFRFVVVFRVSTRTCLKVCPDWSEQVACFAPADIEVDSAGTQANLTCWFLHRFSDNWSWEKIQGMVFSHTLGVSRHTRDILMWHEKVHFT